MAAIDPKTKQAIDRFLALLQPRYDTAGAILYGSRARGTHRADSDADIAILFKHPPQKTLPLNLALADLAYDVLLETGINISPLAIGIEDWQMPEQAPNPCLLRTIAREGMVV